MIIIIIIIIIIIVIINSLQITLALTMCLEVSKEVLIFELDSGSNLARATSKLSLTPLIFVCFPSFTVRFHKRCH